MPADAAADDHDLAPAPAVGGTITCGMVGLAAGGRVVDAERVLALIDPVDAVAHADAGADAVLLAALELGHDVRVGDVGAGHADHVDEALLRRAQRAVRQVGDARGLEHGQPGRGRMRPASSRKAP